MSRRNKKQTTLQKFSKITWLVSIIFIVILGYLIYSANVIPTKYFLFFIIVVVVLTSIHGIIVMRKKTKIWLLILINILAFGIMSVEAFAICKISDTIAFLKANLNSHFETSIYYIVVNAESKYQTLSDIEGKLAYTVKDLDDESLYEKAIEKKVKLSLEYLNTPSELLEKVLNEDCIIIVNSGNFDAMSEIDQEYSEKVRILDTIEITVEKDKIETGLNVTEDPFVIYLSGIDTRSGYMPAKSLSDVNMIIAVNPKTKHLVMVHIPRDYYVQIHGTVGLKDKLTHAGALGGLELSMATIEDLLEIEIPYFVRVNFNSVVNLVDAIGGININSDVDYSFECYTDRACVFYPGLNSVGGRCALAFARERFAYATGDRHRGENQEQVLELIINKVTSSSTIISRYSEILQALDGTFQTNLTMEEITSIIKKQIDEMTPWKMESVNVDGTGAYLPTYSYPGQDLYVMQPKMETVEKAVQKLNEVLETPDEE